ncbi:MAG TPA: hypothetical protein VM253_00955 [Candidatus Limnocylindrales bacterium]|jgi:hypothetical protein|nr:hypothetical protein [Candidatus Limnocylindrales bacterium]
MTGFFDEGPAAIAGTWVAALVTIVVLGGLLGERRLFGWTQHLFAGLLTGFLALLAITEVILPRVVGPLVADPGGRPELWVALALVGSTAAVPWLPRAVASVPLAILIGSLAAFALGGAVIGTILPQLAVAATVPGGPAEATAVAALSAVITGLVLLGFLHGARRGRLLATAAGLGRWLLLVGLGGWLGYLLFSRLLLLVDRIGFLLGDWIGLGR